MLILIPTVLITILLSLSFVLIIKNKPDFFFWLFLNLYFDPGGYVEGYLNSNLLGQLNTSDIFIVGILICLIVAKVNWILLWEDPLLKRFLLFLLFFSIYYFIVYGGIVPYLKNDFNYFTFLIKSRTYFYGIIILLSVYVFSFRTLKYFYTVTLTIGFICLSLYILTLTTGIELAYVWRFSRYENSGMMRITLLNYGLFDLLFPLSLITYILSRKFLLNIKYKPWLYYSGTIMIITEIITLTRRTQIDVIGSVIIIVFIIAYLFRTAKFTEMLKIGMPAILVILSLYISFPKYINYMGKIGEDTFLLITTGKDSSGNDDYRVAGNGDLNIVKGYISKNLLFGLGYNYWSFEKGYTSSKRGATYARAADAAGEVPIYYLIFGFGIVGAILMLPLYYLMAKLSYDLIKILRINLVNYLQNPLIIIFSIYFLMMVTLKFTINLYQFSLDFIGTRLSLTAVLMGLGFALFRKLQAQPHDILLTNLQPSQDQKLL